jgi:C4-dicarboxylate-specific signal transduction histidine kinase
MPDGFVKFLHIVAYAIKDGSGDIEFVGAVMDATAAKRAEDELHKAQAELTHVTRVISLGDLTASVAHEVNQPIAALVTNGEVCLYWFDRDVPELDEARRAVWRMIGEGKRVNEVFGRIRVMLKKGKPQKVPLDLNDVIDETVPLVRRELSSHRIAFKLDLEPGLPPTIGDRVQLQQVIIDLLVNGIQAMADASDRPRELQVQTRQDEDNRVLIRVQDSGIGIEPENTHRRFNSFFTTKKSGMGMGLSICRSIIEAHGGRIWALLNGGPGATFQFVQPPGEAGAQ